MNVGNIIKPQDFLTQAKIINMNASLQRYLQHLLCILSGNSCIKIFTHVHNILCKRRLSSLAVNGLSMCNSDPSFAFLFLYFDMLSNYTFPRNMALQNCIYMCGQAQETPTHNNYPST